MKNIGNNGLPRSYSFSDVPHVNASGPSPLRRTKSDSALLVNSSAFIIWRLKQDNVSPEQLATAKIIVQDHDDVQMRADGCVSLKREGLDGETRILPDGRTRHHYSDKTITGKTKQGLCYTRYPDKSVSIEMPGKRIKHISAEGRTYIRHPDGETTPLDKQVSKKQEKSSSPSISHQEKVLGKKRKRFEEQKQKSKKTLEKIETAAEDARAIYEQLEVHRPVQKKRRRKRNLFGTLRHLASKFFAPHK